MAKKQSLFARFMNIFRANANAKLDKMEDPQKMLDQTVRDYTANIIEAETAVATTIGNLRMAEADHSTAINEVAQWGQKALAASNKADEYAAAGDSTNSQKFNALAAAAVKSQMSAERKVKDFAETIKTQTGIVEQLKVGLDGMKTKRTELANKRDELVARDRNAKTQGQMIDAVKMLDMTDPSSEIGRFEDKIRRNEAQVLGAAEIAASSLEAQFASLEDLGEGLEVEERMKALKANSPHILEQGK